jgi:choline dehydrogenase-like flavoprotein
VVEYGYFDNNPAQLDPSSAANYRPINMFNVSSVPQPGLGGRVSGAFAASVVGGGSTVNGMMFDRGAADDYDNWEKLGNPGWGFSDLLPYFKKVSGLLLPPWGCGCDLTNADSCRVRTSPPLVRT